MTLGEIIAAVRMEIAEPVEGYWRDSQITRYVNDGLRDLNDVAKSIANATLNYAANINSAALPSDFYEDWAVRWTDKHMLSDMRSGTIPDTTARGIPKGYIITPTTLDIFPTPSEAGTVNLVYFRRFPDLVNPADIPALDVRWRVLLVYHAAGLAKLFAGEPEGPLFMSHYMAGKTQFAHERLKATALIMNTPNVLGYEESI